MSKPPRKSIRFSLEPLDVAYLDMSGNKSFKGSMSALVANESYTGCAIVLLSDQTFREGQTLKIKIGNIDPMGARIVWCKTLEENIKKIGIQFTE